MALSGRLSGSCLPAAEFDHGDRFRTIMGKGLNNTDPTSVKNGNFILEPQNDFIFAVAGEELGFVGSAVIIILLLFITIECIFIARKAKDTAAD